MITLSFLPEDFFEGVAAGDEFLERIFALGKHPDYYETPYQKKERWQIRCRFPES